MTKLEKIIALIKAMKETNETCEKAMADIGSYANAAEYHVVAREYGYIVYILSNEDVFKDLCKVYLKKDK